MSDHSNKILPPVLISPSKLLINLALLSDVDPSRLSDLSRNLTVALSLSQVELVGSAMTNIDDYSIVMEHQAIALQETAIANLQQVLDARILLAFKRVFSEP